MQLALRPYVTAGAALVAAGAIAATPVLAPAPEMQSRIQSHAVSLATAIENPFDVFGPVADQVDYVVAQAIQAEFDNPFPIIHGLIGRAVIDANALGEIANSMGQILTALANSIPATLGTAAQRALNGNFSGAVGAFVPAFMGAFIGTYQQVVKFETFVEDRFVLAGKLAGQVVAQGWALGPGQAMGVFSIVNAIAGTLDELWQAAGTLDPGRAVNAIQHGVANLALAGLSLFDTWRFSLDNARLAIQYYLNPPPPVPEEEWRTSADAANIANMALSTAGLSLTTPSVETSTPATEGAVPPESSIPVVEEAAAPVEVPAAEVVVAPVEVPAAEVVVAPVEVPAAEVVVAPVKVPAAEVAELAPLVRLSPKAVPGVTGTTTEASKAGGAVSNSVPDSIMKVTDGIKNVTADLGGEQKPSETSSSSTGSSSESGSNNHDGA
jgi:hypothetical protein